MYLWHLFFCLFNLQALIRNTVAKLFVCFAFWAKEITPWCLALVAVKEPTHKIKT